MKRKLVYLLYRAAQWVGFPFIVLYAGWRIVRDRRYLATLRERLGFLPGSITGPGGIWIHAVSVGEVAAAGVLIRELRERLPETAIHLSVTTIAGRAAADRIHHMAGGVFYAPLDYALCVRAVLRRLKPCLVIVLETEIWPNLWRETRRSGARLMVVNARLSDRAWPRYRTFRWFFRSVLSHADAILAQSEVSRTRFAELGAAAEAAGNLKYDFRGAAMPPAVSRYLSGEGPIWIAASTMPPAFAGDCDELETVLDTYGELAPRFENLRLVLAPRKPEQFDYTASRLSTRGIAFARRSGLDAGPAIRAPVLLLDSIGELSGVYSAATVVFMGGTLAARGGHNLIEPAFYGKPVVHGPRMENFADVAREFRSANAALAIEAPGELTAALTRLLEDPALRDDIGSRARGLALAKAGATRRAAEAAVHWVDECEPGAVRGLPSTAVMAVPGAMWRTGMAWTRRRHAAARKSLPRPVISVGGLAMGGTGKTPMVLWLARELRQRGARVGMLTRGYGRQSGEPVIVPAGHEKPVEVTGDEAALLVRSELGPVGVGAERHASGMRLLQDFPVDAFLLDDGFQHWRLARDLDIVLIDALDPWAGGEFPYGRLREGHGALRRAGAVVVTRAQAGRSYRGLLNEIRKNNPDAPVFRSRVAPLEWRRVGGEERIRARESGLPPVAAFCGLGNPGSFWATLDALGIGPARKWTYPDHHCYSRRDVEAMGAQAREAGAEALVTTAKDAVNLPPGEAGDLPIWQLHIDIEVENGKELVDLAASVLSLTQ